MIRIADRQQFATARAFLQQAYAEDSNMLADRVGDFKPELHAEEPPLVRMFFWAAPLLHRSGRPWRPPTSALHSPTSA
jgi:hypothetical protein